MMTRLKKATHCAPGSSVREDHCGPTQATSTRSTESYDMEPSTTASNNTAVDSVWTLGVGMAAWALTWKVPCALVVAPDTIVWSATVDPVQFAGEKLANAGRTGMACGHKICKCCRWISGEVIVQTCTTEGSVGDVEKGSLVRESKPGQIGKHKVQEFR